MTQAEPEKDPLAPEQEEASAQQNAPLAADPKIEAHAARIKSLEDEVARLKDHLLRAMAETENTRKRAQREREDAGKYAITGFAKDMLDFADNFHRALAAIPAELHTGDERMVNIITGIESMEKFLARNFEKHGITKIEPMGVPFDANFHEVIFEAPGTGQPAGTIIQVIEAGYLLRDRLLRPARVGVAKGEGPATGGKVDTQA